MIEFCLIIFFGIAMFIAGGITILAILEKRYPGLYAEYMRKLADDDENVKEAGQDENA